MEQERDGAFIDDGDDLAMRPNTLVGLRYFVCIPDGSTVTEAWITMTASTSSTDPAQARVRVERVGDSASFTTNPSIIGRFASTTQVQWTVPSFVQGDSYRTADLRPLVDEIVALSSWDDNTGCGHMLFVFEDVGERDIVAFDGSPAQAPILNLNLSP